MEMTTDSLGSLKRRYAAVCDALEELGGKHRYHDA